jgi:DNA adenine methylase
MGSKSRIAKYIVPIIQKYINNSNLSLYIEPFCGGCNVIDKIKCDKKYASDINEYLIELFKHIQQELPLPDEVSKELYDDVRNSFHTKNKKYKDWYIGAVGFLASYNGRFFDGGYAKAGYEKTKNGLRYRNYYQEAKKNILEQIPNLQDVTFESKNYHDLYPVNTVIYCDPPYQGVKQYANSLQFDYNGFWNTMRVWSQRNIVLISEENAPDDFKCIWKQEVSRSIKATDKSKSVEKLFTYSK